VTRAARIAIAGLLVAVLVAVPAFAAAERLSMSRAHDRAESYAESTCAHDKSCADSGVLECRRQGDRVVLCRIYDHRRTDGQGNFRCTRLVRLSLQPRTHRVPVTGVGGWDC
jgi:hypothetical protein